MNNAKLIGAALTAYYEAKGKKLDDFSQKGFLKRVKDFDDQKILEAIDEARFSDEFPDVTVPLKILGESRKDELDEIANVQWQYFYDMVRYYVNIRFDHPITAYMAKNVINIGQCKDMKEDAFERIGKKFIDEYKKIASNSQMVEELVDQANSLDYLSEYTKKKLIASGRIKTPEEESRLKIESWRVAALAESKDVEKTK